MERALGRQLVGAVTRETGRGYSLSFFKAAAGRPPRAEEGVHHDGFHLDTHPELTSEGGPELARILVNLHERPRRLRFADVDRFRLADLGVPVNRGDYQVVALPPEVGTSTVEIPARERGAVHALRFWASVRPHVGIDDDDGYFLASYEAVAAHDGPP